MTTLIIAEVGVNHNGDMNLARNLIEVAANVGADFVKFQTFEADSLVTRSASKAAYQIQSTDAKQNQHEMLRRLELSKEMHHELIEYSKRKEIEFLSTGFDIESLKFLNELGLRFFKIPSGEITNLPYLRYIGSLGKPIVLSTGMSTLHEIRDALEILEVSGTPRNKVTVLHCNTEYPTPIEDVNLNAMTKIRDTLDVKVGYSDHTLGIEVSTAAVALGASIIEKHLTMNRNLPGPDHLASLEPKEFEAMVKSIKNIEKAMGDGIKIPSPSEEKNIVIARKSLVAKKSIYAGEEFTPYNVTTKRPGNGISPMNWDKAMGQIAPRDFIEDELIEL